MGQASHWMQDLFLSDADPPAVQNDALTAKGMGEPVLAGDTIAITAENIASMRTWAQAQAHASERVIDRMRGLLGDLEAAERVLQFLSTFGSTQPETHPWTFSQRNPFRPASAKAYIWEALDLSTTPWLTTNEVQRSASKLKGREIPMSTIQPALSDMRDKHVERRGRLVAPKSRTSSPAAGEMSSGVAAHRVTSRDLDSLE